MSRVGYFNRRACRITSVHITDTLQFLLQSVLNAAARLISGTQVRSRPIPSFLSELVQYKLVVTVHWCLQDKALKYMYLVLVDHSVLVSDVVSRQHPRSATRSALPYCSAVSTKHDRPSGLGCFRCDCLELFLSRIISVIYRSAAVAFSVV